MATTNPGKGHAAGLAALALGLAVLFALACGDEEAVPATPTAVPNVCAPNPSTPVPGVVVVSQPVAGQTVSSPAHVEGRGVSIEGIFVTVLDAASNVIAREEVEFVLGTPTPFPGGGEVLAFTADVAFTVGAPEAACIWVHKDSGDTGLPIHIVQVPVLLVP